MRLLRVFTGQIKLEMFTFFLACQATDYASGYQAYTNLISSGSFSEISSFMPGIKSLMQVATQLKV